MPDRSENGERDDVAAKAPGCGATSVTRFLTFRLTRVHLALNAQAVAILKRRSNLSLNQWRLLSLLGTREIDTIRDCVRKTGMAPSVCSRVVSGLERKGLLVSERADSDRRVQKLELTEAGRSLYDGILPFMRRRQDGLQKVLDEGENEKLLSILDKLEAAAKCGGKAD